MMPLSKVRKTRETNLENMINQNTCNDHYNLTLLCHQTYEHLHLTTWTVHSSIICTVAPKNATNNDNELMPNLLALCSWSLKQY